MVAAAIFSLLPQLITAVITFIFVSWARIFLPFGFRFVAGAMIFLVITEFLPKVLEIGQNVDGGRYREFTVETFASVVVMLPLVLF